MATHSSVLAWRIPGTGEPGGLQSMGSHKVGHDWNDLAVATAAAWCLSLEVKASARNAGDLGSIPGWGRFPWRRKCNPLQYSCLENPMDGGAWWATVYRLAQSRTRLSDFTFTFDCHALEKEMATHSSVLAWRIPGMAEPGGLPSMGSHTVGHDWNDLAVAAAWNLKNPSFNVLKGKNMISEKCIVNMCQRFKPLIMSLTK